MIRHRLVTSCAAIALGLCVGLAGSVPGWAQQDGQGNRPGRGNRPDWPPIQIKGTLAGGQGTQLQVSSEDKEPYLVQVTPLTEVAVTGRAELDWLRPGQIVRFTAILDKKGNALEPVAGVELVTLSRELQPGVSEGTVGKISFAEEEKNAGKGTSQTVVGRIAEARGNKLTVATPNAAIKITLAETARVSIDLTGAKDLALASEGDRISIRGRLVQPYEAVGKNAGPGKVLAQSIDVSLSEPLSTKKRPKAADPKTAKSE